VNAGSTGAAGPPGGAGTGRSRRIRVWVTLSTLAGVIACTLLVAFGAEAVVSRASCTAHPTQVRLATSPDIAPAIRHVATFFNAQHQRTDGHCVAIRVVSDPSASAAAQVANSGTAFDAWIPDSSLWVDVARSSPAGAQVVRPSGLTVATSPLAIVMPRSVAAQMPAFGSSVGWQFLLPQSVGGPAAELGLHVEFPDPARNSAGLASLIELQQQLGSGPAALADIAKFVFNVQVTKTSGTAALATLASLAQPPRDQRPVTVATEQAVAQFDRAHPAAPLAVRYPAQGTYQLAYPYVLTSSDSLKRRAATAFESALRSHYAAAYVQYEGFRSATGTAPGWIAQYGLSTARPALSPAAAPGEAQTSLQAWQRLGLGSRDLVLLDTSAAMATPVAAGGPAVEQVLAEAALGGLAQFPDSTQLGDWAFASHLNGSQPYKELVPVGPLSAPLGLITRRQEAAQILQSLKPVPGAPAALYSSILAAFRQMTATYQSRYNNAVLVLTAGVDNAPGDLSPAQLVQQLHQLFNPRRRVEIIVLMFGNAGNFKALQQIASVTGGQAFQLANPAQINKVFFEGIARRLCQPNCAG
jgi:Bacterial extracellular solute-binding protein/von Willebrand factor type A domain